MPDQWPPASPCLYFGSPVRRRRTGLLAASQWRHFAHRIQLRPAPAPYLGYFCTQSKQAITTPDAFAAASRAAAIPGFAWRQCWTRTASTERGFSDCEPLAIENTLELDQRV